MSLDLVVKRHRPLLYMDGQILTSHYGSLFLVDPKTAAAKQVCSIPVSMLKKFAARSRLLERLLRLEVKTAIKLSANEALVSYRGGIYHINIATGDIEREYSYRNGMNNPLCFTRIEGIKGFENCIAFGEYILNPGRNMPSAIFIRSLDDAQWRKVYEFPAGTVRHIHSIVADKEDDCVYIMTGDLDSESGIWVSRDGFRTVTPVLAGSQTYRTGFLFKVSNGYIYPTDTAVEQNYIYYVELGMNKTPQVKPITEIDGSCTSALDTEEYAFIATTVEADESITGWRSWINYKRGLGIKSNYSKLLMVDKRSLEIRQIVSFKKDFLPYKLFQYGTMVLVDLPDINSLAIYPVGVKKHDGELMLYKYR